MAIVIDASRLVDALVLEDRLDDSDLHAPPFIDAEFANAMRRLVRLGRVTEWDATRVLDAFARTRIIRHATLPLLDRIWAMRHNASAYDAAYVALAADLGLALRTRDAKLARAAAAHIEVRVD